MNTGNQNETRGKAVVTGSSSGIGRAIALALAQAGQSVLVHARSNRAGAEETAAEVRRCGVEAAVVLADLAEPEQQARLAAEAWAWGPIDVWVNNAGADVLTGAAAEWSFEQKLAELWRVDVCATLRLSRTIGAAMRERGSGVILNMSWDQAATGMAGDSGEMFGTIKGAVAAFSKALAASLAPQVRVNCLAPGWIKTAWGDDASDYWQQRAVQETLLGRWGTPEDVARVAAFLASPAAAYMTGQVVKINGGYKGAGK
jgi:3-oxoacyl-[acyl-carrier protein] reductase